MASATWKQFPILIEKSKILVLGPKNTICKKILNSRKIVKKFKPNLKYKLKLKWISNRTQPEKSKVLKCIPKRTQTWEKKLKSLSAFLTELIYLKNVLAHNIWLQSFPWKFFDKRRIWKKFEWFSYLFVYEMKKILGTYWYFYVFFTPNL
jgi:hypothetical protein